MAENQPEQQELDPWEQELAQLEQWVREGRPDLLRQNLVKNECDPCDQKERLDAFLRGMDVACGKGPQHLIEIAFARMFRTCLLLQLRLECGIEPTLSAWGPGRGDAVRQLQAETLPAIERLQRHIAQIAKTFASIEHLLGLSAAPDDDVLRKQVFRLVKEAARSTQDVSATVRESKVG